MRTSWWCSAHRAVARGTRALELPRCVPEEETGTLFQPRSPQLPKQQQHYCVGPPRWRSGPRKCKTPQALECCFGGTQCEQPDCGNTRRESCEHCSQQLGRSLRLASTILARFLRGPHAKELGVHGWHQHLLARLEVDGHSGHSLARPRYRCFDGALLSGHQHVSRECYTSRYLRSLTHRWSTKEPCNRSSPKRYVLPS